MEDQMLLQEVERFILKNSLDEGLHTINDKRVVKTVYAGIEHRLAFRQSADEHRWIAFSWEMTGLVQPVISKLTYRPDIVAVAGSTPDDYDLASLALWLVAVNR